MLRPSSSPVLIGATALILASVLAGCGDDPSSATGDTIDREIFVATFVDLRVTALQGDGELTDAQRAEVLARHDVTEEELTRFVDVHGTDLVYMRGVWDGVEARLDATRPRVDSVG